MRERERGGGVGGGGRRGTLRDITAYHKSKFKG